METKQCRQCNESKTPDEYHKGRRVCKKCVSEYCAKRYQKHKDRIDATNKKWKSENKERTKEMDRQWREANKEWLQEWHREWREKNKEKDDSNHREWRYGVTKEQYDAMLEKANGCCAICQQPTEKLHIDHNHETKQVRDLLCRACNHGIGNFKEKVKLLEAAIVYLKKHQ